MAERTVQWISEYPSLSFSNVTWLQRLPPWIILKQIQTSYHFIHQFSMYFWKVVFEHTYMCLYIKCNTKHYSFITYKNEFLLSLRHIATCTNFPSCTIISFFKSWLVSIGSKTTRSPCCISRTPILFRGAMCPAEEVHFPPSLCLLGQKRRSVEEAPKGAVSREVPFILPSSFCPAAWNLRHDFWSSSSSSWTTRWFASESQSRMSDRKKVGT